MAVNSLGFGIASLLLALVLPAIAIFGIPAIILGKMSLTRIRASRGQLAGRGLAIGGICTGIVATVILAALVLAPAVQRARDLAMQNSAINKARQLALAVINYENSLDKWPDKLEDVAEFCEGKQGLAKLLKNPATDDNPGYAYLKPPPNLRKRSTTVLIYQLRDGKHARDLHVVYADGGSRPYDGPRLRSR